MYDQSIIWRTTFPIIKLSEQIALYTILFILILWCFFGLRTIYNKINTMTK